VWQVLVTAILAQVAMSATRACKRERALLAAEFSFRGVKKDGISIEKWS